MSSVRTIPCSLCGYDAPEASCPHCGLASSDASLVAAPSGLLSTLAAGLRAWPRGCSILLATPRTKRWLVPPVVLTGIAFGALFSWGWSAILSFFDAVRAGSVDGLALEPGFWENVLTWLIEVPIVVWLAKAGGLLVFAVFAWFLALWTFSLAYEALAGPFLDVVHSRVEARWFGTDPRNRLERTMRISTKRAAITTAVLSCVTLALLAAWWAIPGGHALWFLAASPLPFVLAVRLDRPFGEWLGWAVGSELRTLFVSVKASALAGLVMISFFWVKFVPFLGLPLFALLTGFCTSISLLDIPFSRRRLDVRQRLWFLFHNLPAVVAFGMVASLVFVVPFVGPLIGVPTASVGGLWLVCKLDKNALRGPHPRLTRGSVGAEEPVEGRV